MNQPAEKRLFEVASAQQGYFTTRQAVQAGYQISNHLYHVKQGHWTRENRGIYRLTNFPVNQDDQYALWSLWSCNRNGAPQGVYSFDTALSIYDVSDLMPAKIHMTVPKTFRRHSEIPQILMLHRDNLKKQDFQIMKGFRVTTPMRTILDILTSGHLEEHLIHQAIHEFRSQGLLTRNDILQMIEKQPTAAKFFIERIQKAEHPA
jgi:predicted transcriptional regulator of viral defense system